MAAVRFHPLPPHKAGYSSFKGDGRRYKIPVPETGGIMTYLNETALTTKEEISLFWSHM